MITYKWCMFNTGILIGCLLACKMFMDCDGFFFWIFCSSVWYVRMSFNPLHISLMFLLMCRIKIIFFIRLISHSDFFPFNVFYILNLLQNTEVWRWSLDKKKFFVFFYLDELIIIVWIFILSRTMLCLNPCFSGISAHKGALSGPLRFPPAP